MIISIANVLYASHNINGKTVGSRVTRAFAPCFSLKRILWFGFLTLFCGLKSYLKVSLLFNWNGAYYIIILICVMLKLLIWWWQLSERNVHVKLESPVLDWCIKLAWSQIHSFKTVGDVLQESFYFFQSLVAVLEVWKSRCFQWHFAVVYAVFAADFLLYVFYPGAGWNFHL